MCGIIGIIGLTEILTAQRSLNFLTHRGQDASGLAWIDKNNSYQIVKDKTFPSHLKITENTTFAIIGSTRYPTFGIRLSDEAQTQEFAQPFQFSHPEGIVSLVHNGQLTNILQLANEKIYQSDAELICRLLTDKLLEYNFEFEKAVKSLMSQLDGAYSDIAIIKRNDSIIMLVFRDPHGIRPLIWGKKDSNFIFASESVAIEQIGGNIIRDIKPGELLILTFIKEKIHLEKKQLYSESQSTCMFEFVYFASPASVIDKGSVYSIRTNLGHSLGIEILKRNIPIDFVVPVPDSSRIASQKIAETIKVPLREAILKNRYSMNRTFILNSEYERNKALDSKYIYVKEYIENRNLLIVDDSIVRGNTAKKIISRLREFNPKAIIFASTCPPIIRPCYYGIDMAVDTELIARNLSLNEIKEELGADFVIYLGLGDLYTSINSHQLCTACITGDYPTENGRKIRKLLQTGKINEKTAHYEQSIQVNE